MTDTKSTNQELANQYADGLESIAAMFREWPEMAAAIDDQVGPFNLTFQVSRLRRDYDKDALAEFVRRALKHGARIDKEVDGGFFEVKAQFGPVEFEGWAVREAVCERVVVGSETVTRTVPDPKKVAKVPMVEVTTTVEKVEWKCPPLLAGGDPR